MFQWAFLWELTLVTIFWVYLWVMETDTKSMTHQEVVNKIIYDVFIDVGNYEHTVPLLLLLIEFCINNVIFCRTHFYICILINTYCSTRVQLLISSCNNIALRFLYTVHKQTIVPMCARLPASVDAAACRILLNLVCMAGAVGKTRSC